LTGTWFHQTVASESDDALRVSDSERDLVLKSLGEHAAAGRLTLDELEERAGKTLAAKTRGELAAITTDLPDTAGAEVQPSRVRKPVRWMVAILGGSHRRGRFRAAEQLNSLSILGGDEIDLRDAEIEGGELNLTMISFLGGSNIYVPDSVEVETGGVSILGGCDDHGSARPRPGAPLIRIRMFNLLGGVNIYRLPPEARGLPLAKARRLTSSRGQVDIEELVGRHVDRAQRHIERRMQHAQRRIERHQRHWD
jgi:uncharacterized protein DUF1707